MNKQKFVSGLEIVEWTSNINALIDIGWKLLPDTISVRHSNKSNDYVCYAVMEKMESSGLGFGCDSKN